MRLNHRFIGTEHLLLALLQHDESLAALLGEYDVVPEAIRESVRVIRADNGPLGEGELMGRRASLAVELAGDIARQMGETTITSSHLMLAILEIPDSLAVGVLRQLEVDLDELAEQLGGSGVGNS